MLTLKNCSLRMSFLNGDSQSFWSSLILYSYFSFGSFYFILFKYIILYYIRNYLIKYFLITKLNMIIIINDRIIEYDDTLLSIPSVKIV